MMHRHSPHCGCGGLSRRLVLGGLAGIVALGSARARADDPHDPAPRRIDVHHHFFPPAYLDKVEEVVGNKPSPLMTGWSVTGVLDHMDKTGVATAILSMSPWGPHFKDVAQARDLARACNDYAAQTSRDHPGRFGLFAAMPLPDVDGALKEIAYALDTLKADGVGLMTSYGDKWPGDAVFAPVWEELNRRKAVAYFHPNTPECCGNLVPGAQPSMLEWPYDTGRAVVSLLLSGSFVKYPDISWIFSHAGGPVPALAGRIVNMTRARPDLAQIAPQGVMHELTRLYYDTANAYFASTMAALLKFVPASQVLFGSDYPYYTLEQNVDGLGEIALTQAERQAIDRGNAARLLPRFAG
ncbi:MAG TPA: amidohydrolase family protein [Stellaceae bacterium]|jgi:predicted TIM-barrel fold metal-dependent hydrolase|nr:amidohydrolase family protein [Stellaceae bacterium]